MARKKKKIQFCAVLSLFYIVSALYLIKSILYFNKVENTIRYLGVGFIGVFILIAIFLIFFRKNKKHKGILSAVFVLLAAFNIFVGYNLSTIYNQIANLNKKIVYSVTMVTLKENGNKYSNIENIKKKNIGVINKDIDVEIYNLSVLSINNNKLNNNTIIDSYQSESLIVEDLLTNKIDVAYLSTNYRDNLDMEMFEGHEDIEKELNNLVSIKKLQTEKEVTKEEEGLISKKPVDINKPFTILFMGIDSTADKLGNANSTNGDSIMIVTFNPKTMNMTMLSVPRDSYVYVTCRRSENKINSASSTKCLIDTIQELFDIKIDYYFKINFRGLVKLVDKVGGIEVDVPYDVCEQDSKRRWGKYTIYVDKGKRKINGEQALALSRNRKVDNVRCSGKYLIGNRSDFTRGANQQLVVMGIIDKLKTYTNISNFQGLLKTISDNMDTNMSQDTIFSYYDLFKEIMMKSSSDNLFNIQRLTLRTAGQRIYNEATRREESDEIININSLNAVKNAMKVNLGQSIIKPIKTFEYKIGENYSKNIIGNISTGQTYYELFPDFSMQTEQYVRNYCTKNGYTLNVEYVTGDAKNNGKVLASTYNSATARRDAPGQSIPPKKRIDKITDKTLKIKVVMNGLNCLTSTDSRCNLPNFVGGNITQFNSWKNKFFNSFKYSIVEVESEKEVGTVLSQSVAENTPIKDVIANNETIIFNVAKAPVIEKPAEEQPVEDETAP